MNPDSDDDEPNYLEELARRNASALQMRLHQKEVDRRKKEKIEKLRQQRLEKESQKNFIKFKQELYQRKIPKLDLFDISILSENFSINILSNTFDLIGDKMFKVQTKFSEEELDALLSNGNFVLLGRSGTGKTLVAVTKIFLLKMCSKLKKASFGNGLYLRMIFCTSSRILVEEVRKYYIKMEKKFMDLLLQSQRLSLEQKSRITRALERKMLQDDTFDNLEVIL